MERRRQLLELHTRFSTDFESGLANLTNEDQLIVTSFFKTVLPIFQKRPDGYYDQCYSVYEKEILEKLRSKARTIHNLRLMDYLVQDSMKLADVQQDFNVSDDDQFLSDEEFEDFLVKVSRLIGLRHEMLLLQGPSAQPQFKTDLGKHEVSPDAQPKAEPLGDHEEYMTIAECAKFLECSKVTIHAYKKLGLPYYRIGRTVKFKKSEVLGFMKQQEKTQKRNRGTR